MKRQQMNSGFYKSPWFLTLVAVSIWCCGYITAEDNRIEQENSVTPFMRQTSPPHAACSPYGWQEVAESRQPR